jgi:hypothetical protein
VRPKSRAKVAVEQVIAPTPQSDAPASTGLPISGNVGAISPELPPRLFAQRNARKVRKTTSPVMASLMFHAAAVALMASITVASIVRQDRPFAATTVDLADDELPKPIVENLDVNQLGSLDDAALQNTISDGAEFDVAGPLVDEVTPVDFQSVAGPVSLGDMGSLSSLPSDFGTALSGNGGLGADGTGAMSGLGDGHVRRGGGGRRNGGALGSALFFGTKSKGDRFVFVVDNSSSMKGGRLEAAIAELVRTVDAFTPRQSFYVIFVSDQTYPMFYPQQAPNMLPATPESKKQLAAWLPKAILASGKNRELITAMDMAAALQPHAVYLLWDGDLRYSDKVRMDVMTHLTRPNSGWNFPIHTLGMGITSADSEQNLAAIAAAHGGTYQRVNVPTVRGR